MKRRKSRDDLEAYVDKEPSASKSSRSFYNDKSDSSRKCGNRFATSSFPSSRYDRDRSMEEDGREGLRKVRERSDHDFDGVDRRKLLGLGFSRYGAREVHDNSYGSNGSLYRSSGRKFPTGFRSERERSRKEGSWKRLGLTESSSGNEERLGFTESREDEKTKAKSSPESETERSKSTEEQMKSSEIEEGEVEEEDEKESIQKKPVPPVDEMEGSSNRGFELFTSSPVRRSADRTMVDKEDDKLNILSPLDLSLSLPNILLSIGTDKDSVHSDASQSLFHNPSCSLTQNSLDIDNYEQSVHSRRIRILPNGNINSDNLLRCGNPSCRSVIPVDECDCKICSQKTGFCSSCMCLACFNFDSASNTCSWIGCDVCLHWCHTDCALRESFIRNGRNGFEMQFHCVACDHPSEMFGFVKEVFQTFAKEWSADRFITELEYVSRIFKPSKDHRGRRLCEIADQMLDKLTDKSNLPDVFLFAMNFFSGKEEVGDCSKAIVAVSMKREPLFAEVESIVRLKMAEADIFEARAEDATREVEGLRRIALAKSESIDDEFDKRIAKLRLPETQETRKCKYEEVQALERAHREFVGMKVRMEADIQDLLVKMESTKRNIAV